MKTCPDCGAPGPFPNGRRQCNRCYRAAERVAYTTARYESTERSAAEIQGLIKANFDEQQAVLDDVERGKAERIAALQGQQRALYVQKRAAELAERGQAPRERVGVRREG